MPNARKCKHCGEYGKDHIKINMSSFCGHQCAVKYSLEQSARKREKDAQKRRKAFKAETTKRKKAIKTRGEWLKEAQAAFNKFIRLRDDKEPCISCSRYHQGQWHAGHYRTVGAHPELRFNEDNCHKQCSVCNNHQSGNLVDYRISLIKKIGSERVANIESQHPPGHLTIDDIKEIKRSYSKRARELEKELGE